MASRPTATPSAATTVGRSRGLAGLDAVATEWRDLALQRGLDPLSGPDCIRAFVASHGLESNFHLLTARSDGQMVAVLPLVLSRGWLRGVPVRRLHAAAGRPTLRFDLTNRGGDRGDAAIEALWGHLANWSAWTVFELQPVPEGGRAEQLLACAAAAGFPAWRSPELFRALYMDLTAGFEAVLSKAHRSFRTDLRRTRRRLEERGRVTFQSLQQPRTQDLDEFFTLEASGWKGHSKEGKAVQVHRKQLYRLFHELMAATVPLGQFVLHRLLLEDRVIASAMGLIGPSSYHVMKWCYDEAYSTFGPGQLLIESIARDCERLGLRTFDFYGEEYAYERKWTSTSVAHHCLLVFRPNWRGRLLLRVKQLRPPAMRSRRGSEA